MLTTACDRDFEQSLLSFAGMCYSVALSLTKSPLLARQLGEETLLRAWADRGQLDLRFGLKSVLLTRLRKTYLAKYRSGTVAGDTTVRRNQASRSISRLSQYLPSSPALTN